MTRAERAAEKVRKEKEKRDAQDRKVRKAESTFREETRKADNKRRYYIGALAHEAGLFAWSNSEIAAVFAVLARLQETPNPAAVLDGLLVENGVDFAGVSG